MRDLAAQVGNLYDNLQKIGASFNKKEKEERLGELKTKSLEHGFWDDNEKASTIMQEIGDLEAEIKEFDELSANIDALKEFSDKGELEESFEIDVNKAEKRLKSLEISSFLSGTYDKKHAIVGIHAGQGGVEAMDWTNMLYRMYTRYFTNKGWKFDVIDMTTGEEAGLKGVTMIVRGAFAYGYLKNEAGTHRLVRQSPFNADSLRQTSFSLVEVLPELDKADGADIEINDEDLDWQFYRSSGSGGQNVNKVSTAVRLTHTPTGIIVTSQTQRYQQQNRENALALLRSKLWLRKQEEEKKKVANIKGEYRPASWGTQIRSYVLHPYKMVKDLRTKVESPNPDNVLDGNLDEFIEAELRQIHES